MLAVDLEHKKQLWNAKAPWMQGLKLQKCNLTCCRFLTNYSFKLHHDRFVFPCLYHHIHITAPLFLDSPTRGIVTTLWSHLLGSQSSTFTWHLRYFEYSHTGEGFMGKIQGENFRCGDFCHLITDSIEYLWILTYLCIPWAGIRVYETLLYYGNLSWITRYQGVALRSS